MVDMETRVREAKVIDQDQVDLLLKRVAEIQAMLVLVQRMVPFVEDLVRFVSEVAPMLRAANYSLRDSVAKMPTAAKHLCRVSEATELATSEVLDRVDGILHKLETSTASVRGIERFRRNVASTGREMVALADDLGNRAIDAESAAQKLRKLAERLAAKDKEAPALTDLEGLLTSIQDEAYDIMTVLQMQDITAQQLMAAHSLIESVQGKINTLLEEFFQIDGEQIPMLTRRRDSSALYGSELASIAQDKVDELVNMARVSTDGENA